jgi:hypothetical protein
MRPARERLIGTDRVAKSKGASSSWAAYCRECNVYRTVAERASAEKSFANCSSNGGEAFRCSPRA